MKMFTVSVILFDFSFFFWQSLYFVRLVIVNNLGCMFCTYEVVLNKKGNLSGLSSGSFFISIRYFSYYSGTTECIERKCNPGERQLMVD